MAHNNRIIVLGGSFNPPTLAHARLMDSAMRQLDADLGIFVPSSDAYVTRKMSKLQRHNWVMPEGTRFAALDLLCDLAGLPMEVSDCEFGDDGKGHTFDTMCRLQEQHPRDELCFLIGADKLRILPKWHDAEEFFTKFRFAVTARQGDDPRKEIESHPVLSRFKESFLIIDEPEGMEDISSTAARTACSVGDRLTMARMLDPLVADMCLRELKYINQKGGTYV